MKRKIPLSLLTLFVLVGASLSYTRSASSNSFSQPPAVPQALHATFNLMPLFATTTLDVDRTDDTAAASACTNAANDCSLRGAIIASNADGGANPVVINLQPGTTYNLTLANAAQENAAATGDLDITTTAHTVTIQGGGSSGPNATVIDAAGLNSGTMHDRAFQIAGSGVTVIFQDLIIRNGEAADDGTGGVSTNPADQTTHRAGGGILNNGGSVTLNNVRVESCQALGRGDHNDNPAGILEARGGGLASLGTTGSVSVTNSTLSGNVAQGGDGPAGVNNNVGSGAKGGSVYFEGGTLDIEGSRIANSNANGGNGGGVDQNGQTNGGNGGAAQGGGVWIGAGTVTVNNTTFESTAANGGNSGAGGNGSEPAGEADGGGLYSLGNTTVSNSTFHLAAANGGNGGNAFGSGCFGAHNAGDGGAARGGAIYGDGGSLIVDTDTFANNSATGGNGGNGGEIGGGCGSHGSGGAASGGAIANNSATVNVKHATISLNNAQGGNSGVNEGGASKPPRLVAEGTGGGIRPGFGTVTLENTIIAGNTAANGTGDTTGAPTPGPDVDGAVTDNGHNLLGNTTDATGFNSPSDLLGANPMLAALADNGGPTQTMALQAGSPAIDAGTAAGATFDQRGRLRTYDDPGVTNAATSDGTDIGAFEAQPDCILSCPADVSVSNDTDQCGAVVNYPAPSGAACGAITCDHPPGSFFPVGDTTVKCTSAAGPTCSFKVTVTDTEGPTIANLSASPASLWPPNHKMNDVAVIYDASDNCGGNVNCVITSVTSNEPVNGLGDGDTAPDWVIVDSHSVQLRAERAGNGTGRVYTITVSCTDSSGNTTTKTVTVSVPKSQGK
jgi:hypothetical protein